MDKIFEIKIGENIEVVIDSRFKIKNLVEFIRLSFNKLEINDDEYFIYFDLENIRKHKILLQSLIKLYRKKNNDEEIIKRISLNYKRNIKIKIKKHNLYQDNLLSIEIKKVSSKEFKIEFSKHIKPVYNYIKGIFLFHILELYEKKMIISFNENSKESVYKISKKNSIMGYKINFKLDESEFKFSTKNFSVEGSIKEYLAQVRNALSLFGVETIYDFPAIKKEFKRLAKKYHPDLHRNKPELIQKIYRNKFMKIKESYELLEEYAKSKK